METKTVSAEIVFPVEFYDVDSMRVVWHGNYVKYLEKCRCALLDSIGYGYMQMVDDGYAFPVTDIKIKYIRSLRFGETARVKAVLVEYENRIKINYEIYNDKTGILTTKAESTQMAVNISTGESSFICPETFIKKVENLLASQD
ncbi:MAG: acyl-CoA thioesterase [Treponema sp.]|nr:acyl-CoA thioesterase [Treponema sp.]